MGGPPTVQEQARSKPGFPGAGKPAGAKPNGFSDEVGRGSNVLVQAALALEAEEPGLFLGDAIGQPTGGVHVTDLLTSK